ncbi:MAG: hypothetical protein WHV64_12195 [Geminicoccaceae bacterium]|mgnify:CR=1 FL=1
MAGELTRSGTAFPGLTMEWEFIAQVFVMATAMATLIVVLLGRSDWLLWLTLFSFGFGGFNVYAAQTVWFPEKIVMFGVLVHVAIHIRAVLRAASPSLRVQLLLLLIWVAVSLTAINVIEAPLARDYVDGLQGSVWRPFVQASNYLMYAGLVLLPGIAIRSANDCKNFWKVALVFAIILVAGGVVQIGLTLLGIPFMPILRFHGEHSLLAAFEYADTVMWRVYSFAGEPKALASFLVPVLAAVAMAGASDQSPGWFRSRLLLMGVATILLLTFSSSGLIGFALAVPILQVVIMRSNAGYLFRLGHLFAVLAIAVLGASVLLGFDVLQLVQFRTVGRLEAEWGERPEREVLEYLFGDPALLLTGVGPGMIVFHVPGFHYGSGIAPLESGWLTHLAELGIIGLALHFAIVAGAALRARSALPWAPDHAKPFLLAAVGALVGASCVHLGWNVLRLICLFLGVLEASRRVLLGVRNAARSRSLYRSEMQALGVPPILARAVTRSRIFSQFAKRGGVHASGRIRP